MTLGWLETRDKRPPPERYLNGRGNCPHWHVSGLLQKPRVHWMLPSIGPGPGPLRNTQCSKSWNLKLQGAGQKHRIAFVFSCWCVHTGLGVSVHQGALQDRTAQGSPGLVDFKDRTHSTTPRVLLNHDSVCPRLPPEKQRSCSKARGVCPLMHTERTARATSTSQTTLSTADWTIRL